MKKRFYRSRSDAVVAGVCGGLGAYLEIDPVIIRCIWAALAFAGGTGILAYVFLWVIVPYEPRKHEDTAGRIIEERELEN
ncbi:MAG: PspC domain-containing protein [Candidatus Wallbacteria bacterium]|nr:PspC domain-containing protein [Candidatus Wallbacteria bacterium]